MRWIGSALFACALGLVACGERDEFPPVPLPELGDGPVTLTVVRALNSRFSALSEPEFLEVLDQTSVLVWDHFGLEVQFKRGEDYTVEELLASPAGIGKCFPLGLRFTGRIPDTRTFGLVCRGSLEGRTGNSRPKSRIRRAHNSWRVRHGNSGFGGGDCGRLGPGFSSVAAVARTRRRARYRRRRISSIRLVGSPWVWGASLRRSDHKSIGGKRRVVRIFSPQRDSRRHVDGFHGIQHNRPDWREIHG